MTVKWTFLSVSYDIFSACQVSYDISTACQVSYDIFTACQVLHATYADSKAHDIFTQPHIHCLVHHLTIVKCQSIHDDILYSLWRDVHGKWHRKVTGSDSSDTPHIWNCKVKHVMSRTIRHLDDVKSVTCHVKWNATHDMHFLTQHFMLYSTSSGCVTQLVSVLLWKQLLQTEWL